MPAVRLDDECFDDPRFVLMGEELGIDPDLARFKMARVWRYCTQSECHLLPAKLFNAVFGSPKAASAAVDAGLCESSGDEAVRVKGTEGRIEWLATLRKNASKGGKSSSSKRKKEVKQRSSKRSSKPPPDAQAKLKRSSSVSIVRAGVRAREGTREGTREQKKEEPPGHREVVDEFFRRFSAANGGAKPSWGQRQGGELKKLIADHGAEEVQRRLANMFEAPPSWPPPPHDWGTFRQHFDKFARACLPLRLAGGKRGGDGGLSAGDIWDLAQEEEA